MIQLRTQLAVADNTGVKKIMCIGIPGGSKHRYASIGDIIIGSVKKTIPNSDIPKGEVVKAVVVRTKKEVGRKSNPRDSSPYSEDFESFWNAYPKHRRKSKGAAWKAWLSAVKSVPSELIIGKAAEYSNSYDGNRGQYTKLPTTWLNQACWEDDEEAWKEAEDESKEPTGSRVPTQQELDNWNPQG